MIPLTPALVVATASAFIGLREEGGDNRGLMIELMLGGVQMPAGQPWCAAFVHHVGRWSHYDYASRRSSWPLPATASCYVLGSFASRKGVLVSHAMVGDVFLIFKPELRRFAHTGFIAHVHACGATPAGNPWYDCETIEGNTNEKGSRNGTSVLRQQRRFYPNARAGDQFIRWVDLDPRATAASAAA
ncbi:MAG: hypothetical protein WD801_03640 [Gemmatimonadaceae bacterium]